MVSRALSAAWPPNSCDCLAFWPPWAARFTTLTWFLAPCRRPGRQILATVLHSGRPGPPDSRLSHGFSRPAGGLAAKFLRLSCILAALGRQIHDSHMVSRALSAAWPPNSCNCLAFWPPWAARLSTLTWFLAPCRRPDRQILVTVLHSGRPGPPECK